ncbi:MAG: sensor histidine kinase [Bacteroidota bacterium]
MNFASLTGKLNTNRSYRIGAHLLFWVLELLVYWYTSVISFNYYRNFGSPVIFRLALLNTISLALIYYPLVYLLMPLFLKRKYMIAVSGLLTLLILYGLMNTLVEQLVITNCADCMIQLKASNNEYYRFLHTFFINRLFAKVATLGLLIGLVFSVSIPLVIKVALQSFRQQMAAVRLARENVELEFNFLKAQVNPHFLFNSLNNIYGLILKNENDKAAGTVARLSEFMRYALYNNTAEKASLEKEIQLLKDYIELEKIRLNHTSVTFDVQSDEGNYELPTLLLMPMIENAFKFGADRPGARINILLHIRAAQLQLQLSNTLDEDRQLQQTGGIGLQNLRKRLQLYYPGKHDYRFDQQDGLYTVNVSMEL